MKAILSLAFFLISFSLFADNLTATYSNEPVVKRGFSMRCENDTYLEIGLYQEVNQEIENQVENGKPHIEGQVAECVIDGHKIKAIFNYDFTRIRGGGGWDVPRVSFDLYIDGDMKIQNSTFYYQGGHAVKKMLFFGNSKNKFTFCGTGTVREDNHNYEFEGCVSDEISKLNKPINANLVDPITAIVQSGGKVEDGATYIRR